MAITVLLKQVDRAAGEAGNPRNIAIAFGILMDKNVFGDTGSSAETRKAQGMKPAQRKKEYKDLANGK